MLNVTRDHFLRAASEIGQSGENDTLPYDIDAAFVRDKAEDLSQVYFGLFQLIDAKSVRDAAAFMNGLTIGSERLLVPSGSDGFRIATKIHPFWNLYLNGLGLAIAEANEAHRSARARIPIGLLVRKLFSSIDRNLGAHTKRPLLKKSR